MKTAFPVIEYSLREARDAVTARLSPLGSEKIPVSRTAARINTEPIFAARPKPSYDQSTRDGFALAAQPQATDEAYAVFHVIGETAAGCTEQKKLQPGQALRIMTGAMLPSGCTRVVPFEVCREEEKTVLVPTAELSRKQKYIRHKGDDIKQRQMLIEGGVCLQPDHLLLLAENSCRRVRVYRQPRAAVICTGSELIREGERPQAGQKISGNGMLLTSLLRIRNCRSVKAVTAGDEIDEAVGLIQRILVHDKPDLLISTGGMGPGKFDLMEQVFAGLGGVPLYNRLTVRPGRSTLFGMIGNIPFFALPGPPPAVRILFHELVVPGLNRLQGLREEDGIDACGLADALLGEPMTVRETGHLGLKGGVAKIHKGYVQVRQARHLEPINAIMHIEPEHDGDGKRKRKRLQKNARLKVRLIGPVHC